MNPMPAPAAHGVATGMDADSGVDPAAPSGYCVVQTTLPNEGAARVLAQHIVEARLGACVQMAPVSSVYRWQGAVHEDAEVLLSIKTRRALWPALLACVRERHPYDTPELLCLPVLGGAPAYLRWIDDSTLAEHQPQA